MAKKTKSDQKSKQEPKVRMVVAWDDHFFVKTYELAASGMDVPDIAGALGVRRKQFGLWWRRRPALRDAFKKGRHAGKHFKTGKTHRAGVTSFIEFAENNLPDHLEAIWRRILADWDSPKLMRAADAMIADAGVTARMHIWCRAMIHFNFNVRSANKAANVSPSTYRVWAKREPAFAEFMNYLKECRKDFFEGAFIDLVASGDSPATIHAVKTYVGDRGYAVPSERAAKRDGTGAAFHLHAHLREEVDVDSLPRGAKRTMLDALRGARALPPKTVDATPIEEVANDGG